jgi:hypothetical protein
MGRQLRLARLNPPDPDLEYPAADIDLTSTGVVVDYDLLRFRFDEDDRAVWWDELIVVD